jgi:hypothetical protein
MPNIQPGYGSGYGGFPMSSEMPSQQSFGPQTVTAPMPPVRPQLVTAPLPPSRSAVLGDPGAAPPGSARVLGNSPLGWLAALFSGGQGAGQGMTGMLADRSSGAGRS